MVFRPGAVLYEHEIVREGGQDVMYINYLGATTVPSIANSALCMSRVIDILAESPSVSRIVFVQHRNYSYDASQVILLSEIARLYNYLLKQEKILSFEKLYFACSACKARIHATLNWLVLDMLKQDPIGCYVECTRLLREERINLERVAEQCKRCQEGYIRLLEKISQLLEKTSLISNTKQRLFAYHVGNREIYKEIFRPEIIPNFTFTRLLATIPAEAEIIAEYKIGSEYDISNVAILKIPNETKFFYHLLPPEYVLREDYYILLNLARNVLIEHRPTAEEFVDPERTRRVFFNISRDLLRELAESKKIPISYRQLNKLATILVRYTIGFGLVEVLLQDENLQDIVINSPIGQTPIFVRHQEYDECLTNIIPSPEDGESWAAKFRMLSGRPLDEANPVLDTELIIKNIHARVAAIQQPLSPYGLAYAFRRHREKPWTLPLYIQNRMVNPLAAGLLSFLIDGARTLLVAGTRSSGKCVTGETQIQLSNGDLVPIKELVESRIDNAIKCEDGFYSFVNDIEVISMDKDYKLKPKKVLCVWKRKAPEKLIKIVTASGKKITTTFEHPYFVLNDGEIKSITADKLSINDRIATPRIFKNKASKQGNGKWLDGGARSKNGTIEFFQSKEFARQMLDQLPGCGRLLNKIRTGLRIKPEELNETKKIFAYEKEKYYPSLHSFKKIIAFYRRKFEERKKYMAILKNFDYKCKFLAKKLIKELNIKNDELAALAKVNTKTISNFKNNKIGEKNFKKICEGITKIYEDIFETELLLKKADLLANADIFFDKIIKIERVRPKEKYVYDLTVDTENFIGNGIIAHNTSLLGALMLEIMPKYRIIVCEDTLELPVDSLRKLGYDILRMKVRSALVTGGTEVAAEEGVRVSLRLGDSCLVVGEIRSIEARALFEAMRIGALANVVAGTVHGASPYAVFDRIVNDLNVPTTSFKAVDGIIILNPVRSPDGLHFWRRMLQLTEVRKHWARDPLEEKGFVDLLKYNVEKDELEATPELIAGESEIIKAVAANVKGWAGNWDAVWDNIMLRTKIKEAIIEAAKKLKMPSLLEAEFNAKSNNAFHQISDKVREEIGLPESSRVFREWQEWLKEELRKKA